MCQYIVNKSDICLVLHVSINFPQPPTERLRTSTAAPEPLRHQNSQCQFDETNVISICRLKKKKGSGSSYSPNYDLGAERHIAECVMLPQPPEISRYPHINDSLTFQRASHFSANKRPPTQKKKIFNTHSGSHLRGPCYCAHTTLLMKGGVQDSSLLRLTSGYVPFVQKKRKGGESPRWTGGTSES